MARLKRCISLSTSATDFLGLTGRIRDGAIETSVAYSHLVFYFLRLTGRIRDGAIETSKYTSMRVAPTASANWQDSRWRD